MIIQGRRMPSRQEVRSLNLPKSGLHTMASKAPTPATRERLFGARSIPTSELTFNALSEMQLSHTAQSTSAVFDDPNLVGSAGPVPVMRSAAWAGLVDLADRLLSVPTDKGANAGVKVTSLVAGMVAGADSIDDLALLRHGGMSKLFTGIYAPSTLGSFLRGFRFGHVPPA